MVIHNLNAFCVLPRPLKTNPPLIVDSDTVLPLPRTLQGFQPVAGWTSKIVQGSSLVKILQFPPSHLLHILSQDQRAISLEDFLGLLAGKAHYHYKIISHYNNSANKNLEISCCHHSGTLI